MCRKSYIVITFYILIAVPYLVASSKPEVPKVCLNFPQWLENLRKLQFPNCPSDVGNKTNSIYVLYDVNPPEGFNLRRDVYIRLAVFVRKLQRKPGYENVRLVLPPWKRLYHWRSHHIAQDQLPWNHFFDIESLRRYAPVLDYSEFVDEIEQLGLGPKRLVPVHKILLLKHFKDMFENGVFKDKWEFGGDCDEGKEAIYGSFLRHIPILLKNRTVQCVSFQGSANLLGQVIQRTWRSLTDDGLPKIIAFLNAEVVLHDHWADREFWRARRSMRFAENLVEIADSFRLRNFASRNEEELVQRPPMWEYESSKHKGKALGGPYLCVHLRRGDFIYGRETTTPSLKSSALQVKYHLLNHNLSTVFLATDATAFEIKNFKSYIPRHRVVRFATEDLEQKSRIKDGGIAIVDQLICSHAHYFVGTYESTFTYRIYEEREILGFPKERTFNTLCKKSTMENCTQNSVWPIVY
uniref:GDP-fucose protein O-fucosyltransferase 2 n=1 Tax=Musca domestica TaxID=7370 RepID=A0A1I8MSN4_MUSDO